MKVQHSIKTSLTAAIITSLLCATPSMAKPKTTTVLDTAVLKKMNSECLKAASKKGHTVAIAIFNDNGVLLSFNYGGASPAAGEVARWKGLSAAMYRVSTLETAKWNVPTAPKISTAQGGVPLFSEDGSAVGGIGVSGAPPQFDQDCGALAAQAVGLRTQQIAD
ncbi:Uncharacterized conserved protein GlcG, DUF336 family [Alteromonadaceae bacterium Bs31]|nr:Uncharacterized conserved protein GlcG, DUF336 family [Alteromonadaceae bacterium Bs31]